MDDTLGVTLKVHHPAASQPDSGDPGGPGGDTPLKICIAAETYAPEVNGAAVFAERLAHGLAGRGHEVHVICPSPSGKERSEKNAEVWVHYIRSVHWPWHPTWMICMPWWVKPGIRRLIDLIQPDVIHTQAHFVIGRYAIAEATWRSIPLVATNHFMPNNVEPYLLVPGPIRSAATKAAWWDLRTQFERADAITVPTQLAADLLHDHGFTRDIQPVSCGIDLSQFTPKGEGSPTPAAQLCPPPWVRCERKGATTSVPSVLFVGRLSSEKHIDDLIAAVAATDPQLGLCATIIGAGEQHQALEHQARELGVAHRVHLPGKVSHADLVRAYQDATFFCMPSTAELQSIATLEALSSGKPVVLADAVALPHLVRDGRNGYLVKPRCIEALAEAFEALATASANERARMGEVSQEIARTHDLAHTVDTFEAIYRQVIAAKAS